MPNFLPPTSELEKSVRQTFSETLDIDEDPLGTALNNAPQVKDTIYIKRAECCEYEWEGEWARTVRRRKEDHPLMKGGKQS